MTLRIDAEAYACSFSVAHNPDNTLTIYTTWNFPDGSGMRRVILGEREHDLLLAILGPDNFPTIGKRISYTITEARELDPIFSPQV